MKEFKERNYIDENDTLYKDLQSNFFSLIEDKINIDEIDMEKLRDEHIKELRAGVKNNLKNFRLNDNFKSNIGLGILYNINMFIFLIGDDLKFNDFISSFYADEIKHFKEALKEDKNYFKAYNIKFIAKFLTCNAIARFDEIDEFYIEELYSSFWNEILALELFRQEENNAKKHEIIELCKIFVISMFFTMLKVFSFLEDNKDKLGNDYTNIKFSLIKYISYIYSLYSLVVGAKETELYAKLHYENNRIKEKSKGGKVRANRYVDIKNFVVDEYKRLLSKNSKISNNKAVNDIIKKINSDFKGQHNLSEYSMSDTLRKWVSKIKKGQKF